MKIGIGLYRHMLARDYYDFARQAGCTHVVVHLVDYFNQGLSTLATISPPVRNTNHGELPAILPDCGRWRN